jgi:hypothetical protein
VVLQISPDLRSVEHQRYAETGEMRGRPNARQHQELRRVDRPATENDFTLRPDRLAHALPDDLDALHPTLLDDDPHRDRF